MAPMLKKLSILIIFTFISTIAFSNPPLEEAYNDNSQGVLFEFKHNKGDGGSYISTIQEDVYINNRLHHHSEIINRISSNTINVAADGEAFIYATYMTTENSIINDIKKQLSWGEESTSVFTRKKNGQLTISDDIYMPTVRNVPLFPNKKIKIGESWTANGKEVQDVRKAFNMEKALIFPFTAQYTYKEDKIIDGKQLNVIEVNYNFKYESTEKELLKGSTLTKSEGFSKQILYWDNKKGLLNHYDEFFQIKIHDILGNTYLFTGTAHAELTEFKSVNEDSTIKMIEDSVKEMQLDNISVKKGEKGLTISLENIQFEADSNILRDSEKIKLQKISKILCQFTNDLLITGHCAERGSEAARQKLSEERAESVAQYLQKLGVRDEYHIFTQGKGSSEPIASNLTEAGRSKNRRVEIIVLDY